MSFILNQTLAVQFSVRLSDFWARLTQSSPCTCSQAQASYRQGELQPPAYFPVMQRFVTNSLCLDSCFLFSMSSLTSSENLQGAFVLEWQYFQGTRIPETNYVNQKCIVTALLWEHWDNRSPLTYWHTFEFWLLNSCNNLHIEYQLFVALGKQDKKGETLIFFISSVQV